MENISRDLKFELLKSSNELPIVAILGPRQSGKTTLAKDTFPNKKYVSLEDLNHRAFALNDPLGFLDHHRAGAIFDEIQRVPVLFSYLQSEVDDDDTPGRFILTGSHQFSLVEEITQSLAGRIALLRLLPLSFSELDVKESILGLNQFMFSGFYPRIYQRKLRPTRWLTDYFETYVQKDVRQIKNIGDLSKFTTFVKMLAARTGQLLNLSSIGNDCGISNNTANSWLSILEGSFIVFTLKPHYQNFNKRLTKSPKVYFYDSGLLCYLLGITKPDELSTHSLRGGIFESFIISEMLKYFYNQGRQPPLYFWRDKVGNEVDVIIDGISIKAIEIKSGQTVQSDFFKGLRYWQKISGSDETLQLIYAGSTSYVRENISIRSWKDLSKIF